MTRRADSARRLMASAALLGTLILGGCNTDGTFPFSSKANAPLSPAMVAEIEKKNMATESPILVRLFKEEAELEVWKQDRTGRFELLKTYPICRWSGELGPKIKEGDRQAPEGFYSITPAQMNPKSQYYLSFNLGYPNAYDQAWGRTGSQLMVHGDCSSRGCYAMTDEQISEIFALGRESFFGGQKAFQVQAYPFRMTPANMAKHRNNPNMAFWKMLKRGSDHFEVTHLEPKVDVCEKRYVFDAESPPNASRPLSFSPAGKCPAYVVPQEVADAVNDKQRQDELQTAQLIARGTPTAPVKTYADGGMNPVFQAALDRQAGRDSTGRVALTTPIKTDLGTIPTSVNPPRVAEPDTGPATVASTQPVEPKPEPKVTASAQKPTMTQRLGSLFRSSEPAPKIAAEEPGEPAKTAKPSLVKRMFGAKSETPNEKAAQKPALRGTETALTDEGPKAKTAPWPQATPNGAIRPQAPRQVAEDTQHKPGAIAPAQASTQSSNGSVLAGSQPIMPTSNFDSRWSAFR